MNPNSCVGRTLFRLTVTFLCWRVGWWWHYPQTQGWQGSTGKNGPNFSFIYREEAPALQIPTNPCGSRLFVLIRKVIRWNCRSHWKTWWRVCLCEKRLSGSWLMVGLAKPLLSIRTLKQKKWRCDAGSRKFSIWMAMGAVFHPASFFHQTVASRGKRAGSFKSSLSQQGWSAR